MISPTSLSAFTAGVSPTRSAPTIQPVRDVTPARTAQPADAATSRSLPSTPPTGYTPRGSFLNLSA